MAWGMVNAVQVFGNYFNSTLVNDSDYRFLLDENIKNWLEEFKQVVDKQVLWELLKYKI